jgi:preprotein translocase subunit SecF
VFSTALISLGLLAMGAAATQFGTPLKLSIDFTSGSLMELQFEEQPQPAEVRQIFADFTYQGTDFKDTTVTTAEQLGRQTILIRSKFLDDQAKAALQDRLREELGEFTELRFDSVGPTIGQEVTRAGTYAVVAAAVAILIFFIWAFRSVPNAFRYGIAAIVAMVHDILVTSGIFAIFGLLAGWEVDALFLTAILTVIGYSVHDTIIVFDRLRENLPRHRTETFETVCNRSLLETLSRSVVTSVSTAFVVVAILAFGGATITQFVTIILVGIISGTYSSIFNAVPILVSWKQGELGNFFRRIVGRAPVEARA